MLSQAVTNQVGQHRGALKERPETLRVRQFLTMNPLSFIGSNTNEDPENFIEEFKTVFEVMHVVDVEGLN